MNIASTAKDAYTGVRRRWGWFDHLVQAWNRMSADQGSMLAAAITFWSFLALFPVLLLAVSVLGFVLHGHPDLQAKVVKGLHSTLPGQAGNIVTTVSSTRLASGAVGLVGLLWTGLGWIDNLRQVVRTIWHQNVQVGNLIKTKLADLVVFAGLGAAALISIGVTGIGNAATSWILEHIGLSGSPVAGGLTRVVTIAVAVAADVLIFLWLFVRLPRVETPVRRVLKGAVFASVGFEILKLVGAFYIAHTVRAGSKTYGTFALVVGILVWMNLVARFLVYSLEWTVTAPYTDDVEPSGTASEDTAREAGIPAEYAEKPSSDQDPSPNQQQVGGAPTPLRSAVQGKAGVGFGERRR